MSEIRTTIEVVGAKQNNLKNIDIEIPRDKLTVITGVSGSGKSSLAFEVIYGEAQRRFLKSISNFARSRIGQLKKPNVDFIRGLSPVIAIEQKKANNNPRSTIGTVTEINDYLRLLFSTLGVGKCPVCNCDLHPMTPSQIAESISSLPQGTCVELYTIAKKEYGEDYKYLFEKIRKKGYRHILVNNEPYDLAKMPYELDEYLNYNIEILLDKIIVKKEIYHHIAKTIESIISVLEDEVIIRANINSGDKLNIGCSSHNYFLCELQPYHFSFNVPSSACNTCMGVGSTHIAQPRFLISNPNKSISKGALNTTLFNPTAKNSHRTVLLHSLSIKYNFSLETPFNELPKDIHDILFYGTKGENVEMVQPNYMTKQHWLTGKKFPFIGFINELESWYRRYIHKAGNSDSYEPGFIKEAMIETTCPDCKGSRLKESRINITVNNKNIHQLSTMQFPELIEFLNNMEITIENKEVADTIIREITTRLQLLIDIGLHYLFLNRRSDTISGGEMQRIKMSSQISSELMGMLYVMDEPSIGLHPKDTVKVIDIMKKLKNMGNTVIVVEHDIETMKSADYLIEIGPRAGVHGGNIIANGYLNEFIKDKNSLSGKYMTGEKTIPLPIKRREKTEKIITLKNCTSNNLKGFNIDIPLGLFLCVTGVSGCGKSTLVFETLAKNLEVIKRDVHIVPGKVDEVIGHENITNVIIVDQTPIGRNRKSNPVTYIGIFDKIRLLFAATQEAIDKGYMATDFSLTKPNGARCEHCSGDGVIITNLQFMADVESICPVCKGSCFSNEGLEIKYKGKNISEVLNLTVEEAIEFFNDEKLINHKLKIMNELGLGYLTLGQNATTLSGGEAQRIKLSYELGKIKRSNQNLYILDEPTTGLHCADVENLLLSIQNLVDKGHSVIVIEHNLDIIKCADYIIDMGPEGGKGGGNIITQGTPESISQNNNSYTGKYLKEVLI